MARLIEITNPDDRRVSDYRSLRDVQLRQSVETKHGLFIAEGEKVVR
ncbi:MAG TPA: rRNA methyltransferase, partial [Marmoricola sp.]|nr:rRNA methyltransferase [Marmoricola sp.]